MTKAGTTTTVLSTSVTLVQGKVYTAVLRDAPGGGEPLDLILLDDFT